VLSSSSVFLLEACLFEFPRSSRSQVRLQNFSFRAGFYELLSIEESGSAEYTENYGSRRGRWSEEDEFEAGEVDDRHAVLSEWRRPDGNASVLGGLPIEEEELSPPDALEDMEPDEQHFHEATGNAGATFERTYSRAALVLWPQARILAVLNQAGLQATLPLLGDLAERWAAGGEDRQSLWRQAHELAGYMLSTWPTTDWYPRDDAKPTEVARHPDAPRRHRAH
jgi:hypothetical protein